MADRMPPQDINAERSVLGAILIDNEAFSKIADILTPNHFYSPQHKLIYESMTELFQNAKPIDVVTLTSHLKRKKKLREAGGSAYLSEVIAMVPTSANVEEYAKLVQETSHRRYMISFAASLDEQSRTEDRSIDAILDEIESKIFSLSQDTVASDFMDSATLLEMHFEKTEEFSKNPNALRGLSTGLKSLDGMLGGLHGSDLIVLAARPSVGKSSFAFDIARHVATNENKAVAIFSLEMPGVQVIERVLAQEINVSLFDLRMGKMTDSAYARFAEGAGKLSSAKLYVDDTAGINIMQLRSKARKLKMKEGLDLLVVDYLQLMQGMSNRPDNRAFEVGEISRSLKILARELGIPILALSQLNRSVETRGDHIPQLSDLRESGSIEQDADVVIFLARENA